MAGQKFNSQSSTDGSSWFPRRKPTKSKVFIILNNLRSYHEVSSHCTRVVRRKISSAAEVSDPELLPDERTSESPSCPLSDQSAPSSTDGRRAISPNLKQVRYSVGGPLAIDQRTFVRPVRVLQEADSQVAPPTPKRLAEHIVSILTRSTVVIACRQDALIHYGPKDGLKDNGGNKRGPKDVVDDELLDGMTRVYKDEYKDGLNVIYTDASNDGLNAALVDRSDGTTQRLKDRISSRQRASQRYGWKDKMQATSANGMTDAPRCGASEALSLGGSAKSVGEDEPKPEGGLDRSQFYEASFTFLVPCNSKIEEMTIYLQPGDP
ncbi:hypothetical protein RvY_06720-2 [Ramazzottius varieornatus]|uniref:Uncharacterized protein n=1 Tax=Ramazzottius varieornatus TaxID=947166 RepID=A0A1D1V5T6_RAMVA|nr:hypothetical protein RvY_06720-2 [Ramazzottius varieornatus]